MLLFLVLLVGLCLGLYFFMQSPKFGKMPSAELLKQIQSSPNYAAGKFQNQHETPDLTEGANIFSILKDFMFQRSKRSKPAALLPSVKTNLFQLNPSEDIIVWFGHSSYFIQLDGKKILVDPVFSGHASPVTFTTKSFKGSDIYSADDIPPIDYLFITHDHWDHLDYDTVVKLRPKIRKLITGLGTGAHLRYWGYTADVVIEKDWNEEVQLDPGFLVHTTPARHFSGRGFKRQQALWLSFVLQTPTMKLFLGGDSGYDTHFEEIGKKFGPFDLALLECGQYNKSWKYIHMMPEELVQAAEDLQAKMVMPVHWSKFTLALHSWDDSIIRATVAAAKKQLPLIHPMIGEKLALKQPAVTTAWWKDLQ